LVKAARVKFNSKSALLFHKKVIARERKPVISFTFDDFPCSAFREAGMILEKHGVRGTYYVAMGLMNTTSPVGQQFNMEDLHALVKNGHELASHTHQHLVCSETNCQIYETDILKNNSEVEKALNGYRLRNFAYPLGDVTRLHKRMLQKHYRSLCGIRPGLNLEAPDLAYLHRNSLYSATIDLNKIKDLIHSNLRQGGWLIFYTHDVCTKPSKWGCTPEYFEEVVKHSVASGAEILTMDAALDKFCKESI